MTAEPNVSVQEKNSASTVSQNFLEAVGVLQAFQDLCQSQVTRYPSRSCAPSPHSPPVAASRGMRHVFGFRVALRRQPDHKMCALVHHYSPVTLATPRFESRWLFGLPPC